MKQPYEIGTSEPWRGWLELVDDLDGVTLNIGARGFGHDEPATYRGLRLTFAEAAELRDYLARVIPTFIDPTQTRQYIPRPCDACGEIVESELERYSWGGERRRIGWRWRTSWFGHIKCRPKELPSGFRW